jgi:hypothetical protein
MYLSEEEAAEPTFATALRLGTVMNPERSSSHRCNKLACTGRLRQVEVADVSLIGSNLT